MRKEELIKLAKELSELEDLKGREEDLRFIKREYIRLNDREEESFYEKNLTDEFNKYYDILSKKAVELTRSSLEDKKEIIKKAKELVTNEKELRNLNKSLNELFGELKRLPRCLKEQDDELFTEFKEIRTEADKKLDAYYEGIKAQIGERKVHKEEIIKSAKEVLKLENIKEATSKMDALFEEWKSIGFAGKEDDDKLWQEFSEVRKEFSSKRREHFEHMKDVFVDRVAKKEEIIKKIKYITTEAYFTPEEIKEIKNLQIEFKKLGFAGKEKDQELWEALQEAVKKYFDEMHFYK